MWVHVRGDGFTKGVFGVLYRQGTTVNQVGVITWILGAGLVSRDLRSGSF